MDEKFKYSTYLTKYNYKIEENDVLREKTVEKGYCFANICAEMLSFTNPKVKLDIKFTNFDLKTETTPFPNKTFFTEDQIIYWINYLSNLFNIELVLTSKNTTKSKIEYNISIDTTISRSRLILLLSMIRFLFEFPFNSVLQIAMEYKKTHEDLPLLYILNCAFVARNTIFMMPNGHYYGQDDKIPKKISDEDYKIIISKDFNTGYAYAIEWSNGRLNPMQKLSLSELSKNDVNIHKILNSFDSIFNGELYDLLSKIIDSIINETY